MEKGNQNRNKKNMYILQSNWYESTLSQSDKDKKVYTISILKYKHSIVHSTHKHC